MKNLFKVLMVLSIASLSTFGQLNAGKPAAKTPVAASVKGKLTCISCNGKLDKNGSCPACSAK